MLATHWVLVLGIIFNDGHSTGHEETLYKKEYCIDQARVRWRQFYENNLDTQGKMTTICRNGKDVHEFFNVACDRNDICTL